MDFHSAEMSLPDPHVGAAERQVHRLAAQTWLALQAIGLPPTPLNFELWYTHLEGANAELSRRLTELLQHGQKPLQDALNLVYTDCIASREDTHVEALEDGAEVMEQVARDTASQLAAGQRFLQEYGSVLSSVGIQLGSEQTFDSLVQSVAILVDETRRASDLNRTLGCRLTASAAQVQRLRQSLAEVKQDATTDALTGLVNRRGFDARLRRAMSRSKADNTPVCLLIADVDRFKTFNDTYGHKTGDLGLRLVGRLLAENVKGKDTACRYGGEEFALILTGADEYAGSRVAEQVRAALDGKRLINRGNGQHLSGVTMSIGVAGHRPDERAASLIERADAALYHAKNTGRNKVCVSSQTAGAAQT